MRLVFSRDRAAQLDLLLRSFARYAPPEETVVIYRATSIDFLTGYAQAIREHEAVGWMGERNDDAFDSHLREVLSEAGETVTFLCDDDVLYRPIDKIPMFALRVMDDVLVFSLRLSTVPGTLPNLVTGSGFSSWQWTACDPHDHGYPGSLDGHTFRTTDIQRMIDGQTIPNPLILETILAQRVSLFAEERPLMACYPQQALVGVPVNSVADATRTAGVRIPVPPHALNERYLAGERIDLDALDFSGVDGCLHETLLPMRPGVAA